MELSSYSDLGLLILRVAVGAVFLAHGPIKITKANTMSQGMGVHANMVMLLGVAETFAAVAMILGRFTTLAALIIMVVMAGATYFKTQKWGKKFTGENGWELDFTLFAAALSLLCLGAGAYVL
ncbi:MAG: DoxX family protein [Patescibacteria group bacterium]